jgi:hypothetical protein
MNNYKRNLHSYKIKNQISTSLNHVIKSIADGRSHTNLDGGGGACGGGVGAWHEPRQWRAGGVDVDGEGSRRDVEEERSARRQRGSSWRGVMAHAEEERAPMGV